MEFHEKLQELRRQKGITQEELAQALYVSRAAVSKWESGRGYPNIDSLKAISKFYGITVDALLSGEEILTIAQEDSNNRAHRTRNLVFGLLDVSVAMFFLLPFFGQESAGVIQEVSLLELTQLQPWLKMFYFVVVLGIIAVGVFTLATQNTARKSWAVSLGCNAFGALLFILSRQPYAAAFLFIFLTIKVFLLTKKP